MWSFFFTPGAFGQSAAACASRSRGQKPFGVQMDRLSELRILIASLDVRVVTALCRRSKYALNASLYHEQTVPSPQLSHLSQAFRSVPVSSRRVGILRPLYLQVILPSLCDPGEDEDSRPCIGVDKASMAALIDRLNVAPLVALQKSAGHSRALHEALRKRDRTLVEQAITDVPVETGVLERIRLKAEECGLSSERSLALAGIYRGWIIPLSRRIQVNRLLDGGATPCRG